MTAIDDLNKGWTIKRFEELFAEPQRNGIYKTKEFHGRGQKIINMGELFGYDFISDQEMKRVELTPKELEKSLVKDGDLLFARRSLVLEGSGKCSLVVRPSEDTTFESSIIRTRLDKNEAEPKFYYYLFRSPLGRALMSSIATQTAVSGITGSNLVQLRVPHPPLPIQRKIAAILSAYDDLIENNTRRIEILEEMARSIYREWFVKFRFPGHEQAQMVDSELGLIPEGWEVKPIGEIINTVGGGTPSTTKPEYWDDGDIIWYVPKNLTAAKTMFIADSEKKITALGLQKSSSRMFPAYSVMMTSRATIGVVAINTKLACTNQGFITCIPNDQLSAYQIYFWILESIQKISNLASGSTFKEINKTTFRNLPIIIAEQAIRNNFVKLITPVCKQIENLQAKNTNLRQTRDLLLPRLISGEIDLEKINIGVYNAENN